MPTASFSRFDEWGGEWATDINHAYRLAATFGEDAIIWRCPHQGDPMAWVTRVTPWHGSPSVTRATASKRAKIAKAGARLLNRFLPHHKIVVFTK